MASLRYQDVFVPGGFPRHTYNPRIELQLEQRLSESRRNLCKLVTVVGQTKSGKTVLARKVLPREECVWVDGGTVAAEDDFWQVVLEQLDLFQGTQEQASDETTATISGKGTAGANFLIAKGSAELGGQLSKKRGSARSRTRSVSPRVAALRGLGRELVPLVIDDFHYLPRDLQGSVVRALKQPIFDGLPVAIIAIPHRRYDAVKVEKEMTGRISPVEIPAWSEAELRFIPDTGFRLLGISVPDSASRQLASEAIGSPHLMQDFCRTICSRGETGDRIDAARLRHIIEKLTDVFHEVAETIGRPIFEKLARGPRQRTDRIQRELRDGRSVDIYELVLHALAHLRPGLVSLEYEDLRAAIREVSASQIPQLHEVARVLKHMASIAASDQSSTPVIDFEEADKKLHITDPFFAFYLRWGDLGQPASEEPI
jgi:hypothetical protein